MKQKKQIFGAHSFGTYRQCVHDGMKRVGNFYPVDSFNASHEMLNGKNGWVILDTHILFNMEVKVPDDIDSILIDPVPDGYPPEWKQMDRIVKYIDKYAPVLISCIGAHGRTGVVMAAYQGLYMEDGDPIEWVRREHCESAVESVRQMKFVYEYTGLKPSDKIKKEILAEERAAKRIKEMMRARGKYETYFYGSGSEFRDVDDFYVDGD